MVSVFLLVIFYRWALIRFECFLITNLKKRLVSYIRYRNTQCLKWTNLVNGSYGVYNIVFVMSNVYYGCMDCYFILSSQCYVCVG